MKTTCKFITIGFITLFFSTSAQATKYRPTAIIPADTMLNYRAPDFTLMDLKGKRVSLSDYKGKTLVINFWATWCDCCRKAFPSAQLLLNKYNDDPDVEFLFIDTRETQENYHHLVQKLLTDNRYTFKVLIDEKGPSGIQNVLSSQFETIAMPTTLIVDGDGVIRYKLIGFYDALSEDAAIKHLSELIDRVKNLHSGYTEELPPL
jgi:thiol-disulfide isomerase/thioredoxin